MELNADDNPIDTLCRGVCSSVWECILMAATVCWGEEGTAWPLSAGVKRVLPLSAEVQRVDFHRADHVVAGLVCCIKGRHYRESTSGSPLLLADGEEGCWLNVQNMSGGLPL